MVKKRNKRHRKKDRTGQPRSAAELRDLALRDPRSAARALERSAPHLERGDRNEVALILAERLRMIGALDDAQRVAASVQPATCASELEHALASFAAGNDEVFASIVARTSGDATLQAIFKPLLGAIRGEAVRSPKGAAPAVQALYCNARWVSAAGQGTKPTGSPAPAMRAAVKLRRGSGSLRDAMALLAFHAAGSPGRVRAEVALARVDPQRALTQPAPISARARWEALLHSALPDRERRAQLFAQVGASAFRDPGAAYLAAGFDALAIGEHVDAKRHFRAATAALADLLEAARGDFIAGRAQVIAGGPPREFVPSARALIQLLAKEPACAPLHAAALLDRAEFGIERSASDMRAALEDLHAVRAVVEANPWMGARDLLLAQALATEALAEVRQGHADRARVLLEEALNVSVHPAIIDEVSTALDRLGEPSPAGWILARRPEAGGPSLTARRAGELVAALRGAKGWPEETLEQAHTLASQARFAFDVGAITLLGEKYVLYLMSEAETRERMADLLVWALHRGHIAPVRKYFDDLTPRRAQGLEIVVETCSEIGDASLRGVLFGRLAPFLPSDALRRLKTGRRAYRAADRYDEIFDEVHDALHPAFCLENVMDEDDASEVLDDGPGDASSLPPFPAMFDSIALPVIEETLRRQARMQGMSPSQTEAMIDQLLASRRRPKGEKRR